MGNGIDLVVPGLFGPVPVPPQDLPPLPALDRLLGRADRHQVDAADPLASLFARFGIPSEAGQDAPSAAFTRLVEDASGDFTGYWLHADPVHLRPDRDQLLLFDARHLGLTREEADTLIAELNAHFDSDGLHLAAPVPDRWYLRLDTPPSIRTTPLHAAAGRGIGPLLPRGEDAIRWASLLNEVQMLLHDSPVNQARERAGRVTVSGIWPWGGGRLPEASPIADYESVYAEHSLAQGLARVAGISARPLPEDLSELISDGLTGSRLIFWDGLWPAVLDEDADAWLAGLEQMERAATTLLAAVVSGRVAGLDIDPCDGTLFRVTRRALRRFWRRAPTFGQRLVDPRSPNRG